MQVAVDLQSTVYRFKGRPSRSDVCFPAERKEQTSLRDDSAWNGIPWTEGPPLSAKHRSAMRLPFTFRNLNIDFTLQIREIRRPYVGAEFGCLAVGGKGGFHRFV